MQPILIGRAEKLDFPELKLQGVPARIDTGAKTSAIWATGIKEEDGKLHFKLFGPSSKYYTGEVIKTKQYSEKMVASSMGILEQRYLVRLQVKLEGKKMRASFTLANRATQVYPVLVGRNILRGKFVVDVKIGKPLVHRERERARELKEAMHVRKGKK